MRNPAILILGLGLGLGLLCLPKEAHALGPIDLELGAKVGAGSNPVGNGYPNILGFGLGGRAGVSIFGLYGGVNLVYYLGSSQNENLGGISAKDSVHSLQYGFEFGYGYKFGPLILRAQVGVGNLEVSANVTANEPGLPSGLGGNSGYLYLEPGIVALIAIGIVYVGADLNALLLPSGPGTSVNADGSPAHSFDAAFTAHGQVGVRF